MFNRNSAHVGFCPYLGRNVSLDRTEGECRSAEFCELPNCPLEQDFRGDGEMTPVRPWSRFVAELFARFDGLSVRPGRHSQTLDT